MAKKSRRSSKKHRKTRRRKHRGGSKNSLPIIPPDSAFPHSTAGESSDNLIGYGIVKV
jgi:hypothetical protein